MTRVELEAGIALEVQEYGAGPGVVFVHGGAMTGRVWDHQLAAAMAEHRAVAYDLRGCGGSDKPPAGYSVDVFAADLEALIERLELGRPAIVGHGLGAHVALRLAATRPERVSALVLAAAAPWFVGGRGEDGGGFPDELWTRMRADALRDRAQADVDLIDRELFHREPSEGIRAWCLQMALQWPLPVFAQLAATLAEVDHRDVLHEIAAPVLLIHGRHDGKTRYEGALYLAEQLPDARLVTLEDSAHCPHLEQPEEFNAAMLEFLRALMPAPRSRSARPARRGSAGRE